MDYKIQKINVLVDKTVDKNYQTQVRPILERSSIPIVRQQIVPLYELRNDSYWHELRAVNTIDMAFIDPAVWMYTDEIFEEYAHRIASIRFPFVILFESPLSYHPYTDGYGRKIISRTLQFAKTIKKKQPKTQLLSPTVQPFAQETSDIYLRLLMQAREVYDGYSVDMCNDMSEYDIGRTGTIVTELLQTSPKPIYVIKWAIPSYEGQIVSPGSLEPMVWKPLNYSRAVSRLRRGFSMIDSIANSGSYWFYTGLYTDLYKPRRVPKPDDRWEIDSLLHMNKHVSGYTWNKVHFLGMTTCDGRVKQVIFDELLRLATSLNV